MAAPIVGEKIMGARIAWRSIPGGDQALGILKHLSLVRAPARRFLVRGVAAPVLHLAAVEAHAQCSPMQA
jgi:hypothetical protein